MTDPMELVGRATDTSDLHDRIMNPNIAKSEAEWWASREIERLEACIREMVEWRPIETFTGSGQNESVMVAVPNGEGGFIVGEAWRCIMAENDDYRGLAGWWWMGTAPGDYNHDPIRDMNHGDPAFWLPLPPAPGAEA